MLDADRQATGIADSAQMLGGRRREIERLGRIPSERLLETGQNARYIAVT